MMGAQGGFMSDYAVLTAVGGDQPGLVDGISRFLLDCGCNLEDSRMAILGGEFAMIILVSGPEAGIRRVLDEAPAAGEPLGLTVTGRPARRPGEQAGPPAAPYVVRAYAMDHPGIVQRVTHLLAERGVNIRSLDTELTHAPHTGQPLFSLEARVDVPSGVSARSLRRDLEALGDEENVDLTLGAEG